MAETLEIMNERAAALDEIFKSIRDLLTVKITVPLGNPSFKNIHTNQFIYCDLSGKLELENFHIVAKAMQSTFSRYTTYEKNKWYVESVTIKNGKGNYTMDLELNPFASSLKEYSNASRKFTQDYLSKTKSNSTSDSVKSTGNTSLPGGQGSLIDNLVKSIVGNVTDPLEKCKLIHEWLRKNVVYSYYECSKYKTPENCYNNRGHLNCADTATLTCAMMLSAGLNAYIVHRTYNGGHFWTIIEINGVKYASDQTGRDSPSMSGSAFNTVWKSSGRTTVSNGGDYSRKNGNRPDC